MKLLCTVLLLFSLTTARAQPSLYVLGWQSPLPVQIERVEVTGGSLVQVLASGDGLSGTIAAASDRECLTIVAEGMTTTGAGVRLVRSWDAGCVRLYFPFTASG